MSLAAAQTNWPASCRVRLFPQNHPAPTKKEAICWSQLNRVSSSFCLPPAKLASESGQPISACKFRASKGASVSPPEISAHWGKNPRLPAKVACLCLRLGAYVNRALQVPGTRLNVLMSEQGGSDIPMVPFCQNRTMPRNRAIPSRRNGPT